MNDIKILFEDSDILVLDKPAGITVNRADTTKGKTTVQDFVEKRYPIFQNFKQKSHDNNESDFYKRAGIVHRIDKETSGILIVAKTKQAFENLQAQFKQRNVSKTYIALVHKSVVAAEGEIDVPVGRLPWNRERFGVLAGARQASTKYKVLETFVNNLDKNREVLTLVELTPKTGRTHQIRVHLKYFNHPIFGDFLYAGRKTSRIDRKILPRIFLHAKSISFTHPKTGKTLSFESSLPYELTLTIDRLKH
ncbi:MAG: RluA family pseudouridine synthase [Candidatus Levybacteria bacterium]|nr:RluA family pseudouridine synthase [Candidatus Levybacteria bacterium]